MVEQHRPLEALLRAALLATARAATLAAQREALCMAMDPNSHTRTVASMAYPSAFPLAGKPTIPSSPCLPVVAVKKRLVS